MNPLHYTFDRQTLCTSEPYWYTLKTKPRQEALALKALAQIRGVGAFCPRIRYRRNTHRGVASVTELLFPGYLFARFSFAEQFRKVRTAFGVNQLVHFGQHYPKIPDTVIKGLRAKTSSDEPIEVPPPKIIPGQSIEVISVCFRGFKALVQYVLPRKKRVQLLLDFLGQNLSVDYPLTAVVPERYSERQGLHRGDITILNAAPPTHKWANSLIDLKYRLASVSTLTGQGR